MRSVFFARLFTALALTGLIVFRLATADLAEAPRPVMPSHASASNIILAGMRPSGPEGSPKLVEAYSEETSSLLWSYALPLDHQSPETTTNVMLAAEAVDLSVLCPGETFSFNDIVGIRTEEKGYQSGLMFSNGEVVTGIGGGICIASTALYKGALESGLKILERHPHSGPVSYADPGRDAAVSYGWADLRFKNNTDGLLIVRAKAVDDRLMVALYGKQKPGRTVEVVSEDFEEIPYKIFEKEDETIPEGELQVKQKARPGFAVTTVRLIKQDGKLVSREAISRDTVLPRHKIILVPPKPDMPAIESPEIQPLEESAPGTQGVITVPEDKAQPESSLPSTTDGLDRSRDTSDRTLPTASE